MYVNKENKMKKSETKIGMKDKKLIPRKEFDRYYNMDTDELYGIDVNYLPYYSGELIMILSNPHEDTYEELKNSYVLESER